MVGIVDGESALFHFLCLALVGEAVAVEEEGGQPLLEFRLAGVVVGRAEGAVVAPAEQACQVGVDALHASHVEHQLKEFACGGLCG